MIHLGDRDIYVFPGFSPVKRKVDASIVGAHDSVRQFWIEPHIMVVSAWRPLIEIFYKSLSAIYGLFDADTDGIKLILAFC